MLMFAISSTRFRSGQKYERTGRAPREPVRCAGRGSGNSHANWGRIETCRTEHTRAWHDEDERKRGGIVTRNYLILGMATLAVAGALLAQDGPTPPAKTGSKKAASHASSGSAARGKEVFEKKCASCHYPNRDSKKIGPRLK